MNAREQNHLQQQHASILLLGGHHVGKSSILRLLSTGNAAPQCKTPDLALENSVTAFHQPLWRSSGHWDSLKNETNVLLELMDLDGDAAASPLLTSNIASADAFMLIFDVSDVVSFQKIWHMYQQILKTKSLSVGNAPIVLMAHKSDLRDRPTISLESTLDFGSLLKISAFQTSIFEPSSLQKALDHLLGSLLEGNSRHPLPANLRPIHTRHPHQLHLFHKKSISLDSAAWRTKKSDPRRGNSMQM